MAGVSSPSLRHKENSMNRLLLFLAGTVFGYIAGGYLDGLRDGKSESRKEA